jgi:hypothetical protein
MESHLEKRKVERLSLEEIPELETIGELDRIFTHMNAMLAAQNVNSCKLYQMGYMPYLFIVKIYKFRSKLLIYCMIGQPVRSVNLGLLILVERFHEVFSFSRIK